MQTAAQVDVLVAIQPVISDGRLAPVLAQQWKNCLVLWATPEEQSGEMISGNSLVCMYDVCRTSLERLVYLRKSHLEMLTMSPVELSNYSMNSLSLGIRIWMKALLGSCVYIGFPIIFKSCVNNIGGKLFRSVLISWRPH